MKIITRLLALLFLVGAISCSKTTDPVAATTIVGTWKETTENSLNCIDPSDNYTVPCSTCETLTITATLYDGTPYTITGNKITLTFGPGLTVEYIFSVTATSLSIVSDSPIDCDRENIYVRQ